ncbi:hypothetical protein LSH36_668g01034 [Paralvinella palmiformis]|uniref:Leukotriene A(4) hydrolase n=1 Tax=Paralvinella palmiformis TaxID=53620 RepID=A0AAD9MVR3_9ANNE|nr:hypothetical protein LSH36_668g01034 [Paralvinella palmiformis]
MPDSGYLSANDPNSYANVEDIIVTSLDLDVSIDFKRQILKGAVTLSLERKNLNVTKLVLDTRDLNIDRVIDADSNQSLLYTLGQDVKSFGSKLEIQIDVESKVKIFYETSPSCSALQWLTPEQTAGKNHPYLFSQNQAIHCRSMIPCQDTPSVKTTYTAMVAAPAELVVLMSAVKLSTESHPEDPLQRIHKFKQKIPIPSYLIAVVAGSLEYREIGPRSRVWSEKEMVDAAAFEFAETEKMIQTAEDLLGPYVWDVYDLLVLPPSFPYGGMENPCLTFVTPTLLAGDRSLANVIAHEITHSWMGNLITNCNWEHFWLNEGNTVFVERKILGRMFGEKYRHFSVLGGWKDLKYQVEDVLGSQNPFTHLVPSLSGVDPDDAFSCVPYEKGSNLLMYLEQLVGGAEIFEGFLRAYVDRFKQQSITTQDWKDYLYLYFKDQKTTLDTVDWDTWFYKPGMPPIKPECDSSLADVCIKLATRWSQCTDSELDQFNEDDIKTMSSQQIRAFLAELLEKPALNEFKINKMDQLYRLSDCKNSEIRFRWLRLCLHACVSTSIQPALDFINQQGRMKFVRPIYRDLYLWEKSRQMALDNYNNQKTSMHSLTANMVGKDLKVIS